MKHGPQTTAQSGSQDRATETTQPPRHLARPTPDHALGNLALQGLLTHGVPNNKLAVASPNDSTESDAARMAETAISGKPAGCTCASGEPPCPHCITVAIGPIHRKPRSHDLLASSPQLSLGSGQQLPESDQVFFASRYRADLSDVRIHDNPEAAASAAQLNARAFALGSRIAFGGGEYRPHTGAGRRLLAHELAHVVQEHGGVRREEKTQSIEPIASVMPDASNGTEESIEYQGITLRPNKEDIRAALATVLLKYGKYGVTAFIMGLESTLPHKFCNPMLGSCHDVPARGPATTPQAQAIILTLLPMLRDEVKAIEKDHDAFKAIVRSATQLRLQANLRSLELWRSFIDSQITPLTLQGQVASTVVQRYSMKAFHHPDQARAYQALAEMTTSRNAAYQRTQAAVIDNLIRGGCQYCHTLKYETDVAASQFDPRNRNFSIMEQLVAGSEGARPWFVPDQDAGGAPMPRKDPGVANNPILSEAVDQANRIQPYLKQLGSQGYKILPLDDIGALGLSPEALHDYVLRHIDQRMEHFRQAIEKAGASDFDYLIPHVVVQELVLLQDAAVQAMTQADIRERAEEARNKADGVLVLSGVSLLLTIFPPTTGLGLALGAASAMINYSQSSGIYQQGVLLEHMTGARNVLTPQQDEAAQQMKTMGRIGMVLSALDIGATSVVAGFKVVRLVRGPGASGVIKTLEIEAGGNRVVIDGMDTSAPVATAPAGNGPPTRIILPGDAAGGVPSGSSPGGSAPSLGGATGPVTLYLPGQGVNPNVAGLSGPSREAAVSGRLILLDELGRPISVKQTQSGKLLAEMETTLHGESRLVDPAGRPLHGQSPSPWQPLVDVNGRTLPPSSRQGPVAGDLDMASQIARNSPHWPSAPMVKGAKGGTGVADEAAVVTRPTPRTSEIDVGVDLPAGARAQVSFKNGQEVPYGTSGSVRPDWCIGNVCSVEVKNYNITTNSNGLVNNVSEQAIQRAQNLPQGMTQTVVIDIRGQIVTDAQKNTIIQGIVQKSNGSIRPTAVSFKE
jgi:hypothetical protein